MSTCRRRRTDPAHHHPVVSKNGYRGWSWQCRCGGASCRTTTAAVSWRQVVVQALVHSADPAA